MIIIDRFEGNFAVIETEEGFINFPKGLLPAEAREGDVLRIEIDRLQTDHRKKEISALMDELFED